MNINKNRDTNGSGIYEIVLQGHLDEQWVDWFDDFALILDERGQTILVGPVADQAALHGLFKKIRDLGLRLISVRRLDPGEKRYGPSIAGE